MARATSLLLCNVTKKYRENQINSLLFSPGYVYYCNLYFCEHRGGTLKNLRYSCNSQNFFLYLHRDCDLFMRTAKEYIDLISAHADELRSQFGIRTLRLFGSVSRGEQREDSDVDICVDMEPSLYLLVRLKRFLEQLLQCSVDVVRMHRHINPYLLENIERDGIYVIR